MYLDCWQADRRLHMKTWALGSSSSVKFGFWNPLSLLGLCSAHSSLLPWALQWFYLMSCQKLLLSGGISTTLNFVLPASFSRTDPVRPILFRVCRVPCLTSSCLKVSRAGFSYFCEGPGFCFLLCLRLTEMARSCLSCLSQRLETWNSSKTVTLPYVENLSITFLDEDACTK